jgi:4-hydroxybenzoate polyprenyltransferase
MPRVTGASVWRDIVVLHRLEFPLPVNYVCQASWGACFAVEGVHGLLGASVAAAIGVNLLLIVSALALNNAVDISTDERHQDKVYLASATARFGRARALRWAATEMAAGLALAVAISWWSGRWLVTGMAVAIIAGQLLYNLEPVRLKRRGFAGAGVFGLSVTTLPCLLSYSAVRSGFDTALWPIFIGLGVLAVGRTAWWSVPDRAADTASGIATPTVRYGAGRTLVLSCVVMVAGLGLLGWGLWSGYGPAWVLPGVVMHAVLVGSALALLRHTDDHALPSSVRMLRRAMPLVAVGDVLLVVIPLAVG